MASELTKMILNARNKSQEDGVRSTIRRTMKKVGTKKSTGKSLEPSMDGNDVHGPTTVIVPSKALMKTPRINKKIAEKSKKTGSDGKKQPRATSDTLRRKRVPPIKAVVELAKVLNSYEGGALKNTDEKISKSSASKNEEKTKGKVTTKASMPKATKKQTTSAKAMTTTVGKSTPDTKGKGRGTLRRKKVVRGVAKDMDLDGNSRVQDAVKKITTTMLKRALRKPTSKPIVKTENPLQADNAIAAAVAPVVAVDPTAPTAVKKSVLSCIL